MRSLRLLLISAVVLCAGLLSACGGADDSSPASAPTQANLAATPAPPAKPVGDIVISGYSYTVRAPVRPGQQLTIINDDEANHSVVADANDAFDVRVSGGGGITTFTAPMAPGAYPFHCDYHAGMHGMLTVQ